VLHDDLAFLRTIVRLLVAANRRRAASVDGKNKVEDWFHDTDFVEQAVLVAFDDGNDRSSHPRIGIGTNYKILSNSEKLRSRFQTRMSLRSMKARVGGRTLCRVARIRTHCC
jgi:hypothetical protein